jgi:large subunit ribosomal protein L32
VNQRRSHFALKKMTLAVCPQCKHTILPHTACKNCGYYKGREAVKVKSKKAKGKSKK